MKMAYYDAERERQEAVRAGERALESLRDAEHYLGGARLWGIVDLFGGSGLSGLVKHVRIGEASRCLERAKSDLRLFQKELRDVDAIRIDIGGFLTFADFFFDGIIADWLVQSKIQEARRQVADAIKYARMVSTGKGVKNMRKELRKSKTDRRICGVCGGIADYIGVDSNVVRLIWAAITLFAGAGLLLYIIAAIILPEEEIEERDLKNVIHPEESGEDKEA